MYQGSSTKQCLICHKELNQQQDLFHLVNNSSLCLSCIRKFKIINSDIRIQGYHVKVLYEYNDFFRQLLFQYKANLPGFSRLQLRLAKILQFPYRTHYTAAHIPSVQLHRLPHRVFPCINDLR